MRLAKYVDTLLKEALQVLQVVESKPCVGRLARLEGRLAGLFGARRTGDQLLVFLIPELVQ